MKQKIILILAITINLLIWINSLMPGNISSTQSGIIGKFIYPIFENIIDYNTFITVIRKLAHFTEFAILSLLFTYVYKNKGFKRYYLLSLIHCVLTALIDEFIQIFVPGRAGLITDVLIDSSGVIFGLLISLLLIKLFTKEVF